jgi:hypothetical protein
MRKFVFRPNLPESCAAVIYGEKYAGFLEKTLDNLHIESLLLPDNPAIDPRLAGHADLSLLHMNAENLCLAPYLKGSSFADTLQARGAEILYPEMHQGKVYPLDAQLNVCMVGKTAIFNDKITPKEIADFLINKCSHALALCRQGYCRCAACIVDERSIITADRGIALAAESVGLQVLLIRPGYIRLDGYTYGFLGGASFKIASDKLAFTGRLDKHPDCDKILAFLDERRIAPVYLTCEPLFDIGSAVPIIEQ